MKKILILIAIFSMTACQQPTEPLTPPDFVGTWEYTPQMSEEHTAQIILIYTANSNEAHVFNDGILTQKSRHQLTYTKTTMTVIADSFEEFNIKEEIWVSNPNRWQEDQVMSWIVTGTKLTNGMIDADKNSEMVFNKVN